MFSSAKSVILPMYQLTLHLGWFGLSLDEVESIFRADTVDGARLVAERHAITLVCNVNNLRSESGADKLGAGLVRNGLEKRGNSSSVLRIQVGVDFIKDDHGATLGLLQRKDETESTQT